MLYVYVKLIEKVGFEHFIKHKTIVILIIKECRRQPKYDTTCFCFSSSRNYGNYL